MSTRLFVGGSGDTLPPMTTHFIAPDGQTTLCGLTVEAVILKQPRNPGCSTCSALHQAAGWTFPLPDNVTTPNETRSA